MTNLCSSLRYVLLAFCLSITFNTSSAQQPEPIFRHYGVEEGLPSSEVYHTLQDSKGYIWFATDMGVSRYDGYSFKNYSLQDGLPDNTVFNIFEDYKGRIWFAAYSGKLAYFEDEIIYEYKYNSLLSEYFKSLYKSSFYVDRRDNVYISVYLLGYFVISSDGEIQKFSNDSSAAYHLVQLDSATLFLSSFTQSDPGLNLRVQTDEIDTLISLQLSRFVKNDECILRKGGSIVFAVHKELLEVYQSNSFTRHPLNHISIALMQDEQDNIWIGTFENGVRYYANGDLSIPPKRYLRDYSITSILRDREGAYWFTTLENGVYYMASNDMVTYNESSGLAMSHVSCLATDNKGTVFASLKTGIVQVINDSLLDEIHLSSKWGEHIYNVAIMYDNELGNLHIAANESQYLVYDLAKKQLRSTVNSRGVYDMVKRRDGTVWAATSGSLGVLENLEWAFFNYSRKDFFKLNAIYEDREEKLWVGGLQGLALYENDSLHFNPFGMEVLNIRVTDITSFRDDILCIGTRGGGVLFIDGDSVRQLDMSSGLASDNVERLFADGDVLWLATNNGLNKVTFSNFDNWNYDIEVYTVNNGLASNELNDIVKVDDRIWVASNKGLTVFDVKSVKKNHVLPPIWINRVRVAETDTLLLEEFRLSYDQNNLLIGYIGLAYRYPGQVLYRYKMEGIDSTWEYTKNTSVKYTTMPHGEYTFLVSASNEDGYWSPEPAQMTFVISPPFWETWWFRVLIALTITGMVYTAFKIRILTHNRDVTRELILLLVNKFRRKKFLFVKVDGKLVRIDPANVLWLKAAHNYVEVQITNRRYLVRSSMAAIEKRIPGKEQFIRVHRSYIVCIDKIDAIDKDELTIQGTTIPISESFKSSLKELRERMASVNS